MFGGLGGGGLAVVAGAADAVLLNNNAVRPRRGQTLLGGAHDVPLHTLTQVARILARNIRQVLDDHTLVDAEVAAWFLSCVNLFLCA